MATPQMRSQLPLGIEIVDASLDFGIVLHVALPAVCGANHTIQPSRDAIREGVSEGGKQSDKVRRFGEMLADIVMPDADTVETESTLELNFLIGKIKHTVKKIRKNPPPSPKS